MNYYSFIPNDYTLSGTTTATSPTAPAPVADPVIIGSAMVATVAVLLFAGVGLMVFLDVR